MYWIYFCLSVTFSIHIFRSFLQLIPSTWTVIVYSVNLKKMEIRQWFLLFNELWARIQSKEINDMILLSVESSFVVVPSTAVLCYVVTYLGSNRIFNTTWSYGKMPIDWVILGWTGKFLALSQDILTSSQIFSHLALPLINCKTVHNPMHAFLLACPIKL